MNNLINSIVFWSIFAFSCISDNFEKKVVFILLGILYILWDVAYSADEIKKEVEGE